MTWSYLVELDVITKILISEKGKGCWKTRYDGLGRRDRAAKPSFPLLGVMDFSPRTPPTKARIPPNL